MDSQLIAALDSRRQQHLYRNRQILTSPQSVNVEVSGHSCLAFCSNDYLGLANHPDVINAFRKAAGQYGVGSGASHLIYGHSREHHALEEELAEFTGRPRALLFSTGYMANLGVMSALLGKGDYVLEDRLNHASLLDGGLASGAAFKRYRHSDMDHLSSLLAKAESGRKLVVTDGVFSMDGDLADLPGLINVCAQHNGWLMVDDAHGFGVLGDHGGGLIEQQQASLTDVPILMGTLGKGFGTFGAFVAGSEALIETLIQFARSYIYTTALPPAIAAATRASLKIVREEHWRREKLSTLIQQFRTGVKSMGLNLMDSPTPIQPVLLNSDQQVLEVGEKLRQRGVLVGAIRPPTVPVGTARLRVTLSAAHSDTQVDKLLVALAEVLDDFANSGDR
ncbi:MAG: 8-amino-7-oxononanoate synthase [Porticoccaceae bacterium]|nr:8-amino-7-oxononanoate synthase [Pseudomonadales bacterium]